MITPVFVYGTLKRGYGNNRVLLDSEFIGEAVTVDRNLVLTNCGFPFMIENPQREAVRGSTAPVLGEVYLVSQLSVIEALDRLEGVPDLYMRYAKSVRLLDSGREVHCFMYIAAGDNGIGYPLCDKVEVDGQEVYEWKR